MSMIVHITENGDLHHLETDFKCTFNVNIFRLTSSFQDNILVPYTFFSMLHLKGLVKTMLYILLSIQCFIEVMKVDRG